jgi:sortase B
MKLGKVLYWLLVIVLAIIFLVSASFVARYAIDALRQKNEYNDLAALVEQARSETEPMQTLPDVTEPAEEEIPATEPAEPTEPVMLADYVPLYEINSDIVGWLEIENLGISYPVMQTPDSPDYYLTRNFNKQKNAHGCLYVRESCDVFAPSDNVTIYGHNMKNGTMFAGLKKYLYQDFWEENQTFRFDTLYERNTYTVFAVFTTTASVGKGFAYHRFEDAIDEADFDDFIANCKALAKYDTGITPTYGDKIICLSTCEYSQVNGRLVIAAVRNPS